MCGHSVYSFRALRAAILEQLCVDLTTLKLRFIINILEEMRVCEFDRLSEDIFEFEIAKSAEKGNIELTKTYQMLEMKMRA